MIRALVIKELRETAGIAVVALAIGLAYVGGSTGSALFRWVPGVSSNPPPVPFVAEEFLSVLGLYAGAIALTLGFWQSVGELVRGTARFLLHRPLSRRSIVLTKLLTGLAVYFVCVFVPVLIYAGWASRTGTHAGPFFWSMTLPSLFVLLSIPLLYFGAFASGWREARWIGSRLLPLAGAGCLVLNAIVPVLIGLPDWWPVLMLGIAAAYLWLIGVVLAEAATRDF